MSEQISRATFAQQVKTKFRTQVASQPAFELELTEVKECAASPQIEQFSLFFLGPPEAPTAQGLYQLTHAQLGTLEIFLVPIGKDQVGVQYEAVFNRMLK
jgi:hypothetical protein